MLRTLMCLPLCLLLAPSYPIGEQEAFASRPHERVEQTNKSLGKGLPDPAKDVIPFLEACLKRYQETVKGYTLTFRKRERTGGTLHPWETIEACYTEQPHRAFFDWQEGARKAMKALYVEGENKNASGKSQIVALPAPPLTGFGPVSTDTDSADSKKSGRYPLSQFGLKQATQRVVEAWKAADEAKTLHVDFKGTCKLPEAGGQVCYEFHRHSVDRPEGEDGVTEVTIYIDCETLFQVGSIVKGKDGELLGEYYFKNIRLNPEFKPDQFTRAALKKV
jgi:hypothetical protein